MAIQTFCSGCGRTLSVADENAGKRARCPACGHIYTVPAASDLFSAAGQPPTPPGATSADESLSAPFPEDLAADLGEQPSNAPSQTVDEYWMKAEDQTVYGPVDRVTLDRWFTEGRVGPTYQIRQGGDGTWQAANTFRRPAGGPANPFADRNYRPPVSGGGMFTYPKADQGGLILAMGILSFFVCPVFAVVAWVMGHTALNDIKAGRADPRSLGMVQVGYYLGIINVVLTLLCVGGYVVLAAVAIAGGGM